MRVLVYTSLFPNHLQPDSAIFIRQRMLHFAKLPGCRVTVVAPVPFCPSWFKREPWHLFSRIRRHEVMEGVDVYHPRYPLLPQVSMPLHGLLMLAGTLATVQHIRRQFDFDLIDGHYIYPDGLAAVLLGRYFRRPVVLSARGSDINQFSGFALIRPQIRFALGRAERIISVCRALADEMIALGASEPKVHVVPNGIDASRFQIVDRKAARRSLGLPEQGRIILSVGSLIPRKSFDLLLTALSEVLAKVPDAALYIIGAGPERGRLETLIRASGLGGKAFLTGSVPNTELGNWYNAADVFCLASSREGWANVLMEALACGTPVVATNVWGAPEIVTSCEVGILVERSAAAIADGLITALRQHWHSERLRAHVAGRTWLVVAREVQTVFSSVFQEGCGVQ